MAYKVTDSCIGCGACFDACPTDAITIDDVATINDDICVMCGSCQANCPVGAIAEE